MRRKTWRYCFARWPEIERSTSHATCNVEALVGKSNKDMVIRLDNEQISTKLVGVGSLTFKSFDDRSAFSISGNGDMGVSRNVKLK
ncbi:hypothetical protein ACOSQ2_010475 [Xanthoceras sorbifolium]